jgi:antitoxin PrlF
MNNNPSCCKVDAVVTVDSKGQIVLPKDLREKADLKPDDKLALITCEENGKVCCITLVKAQKLEASVKDVLSPMLKEILK